MVKAPLDISQGTSSPTYCSLVLTLITSSNVHFVRMDNFKLERGGGEWFKEGFRSVVT